MARYPANFTVAYPEKLSRGWLLLKVFFGWAYVGIPHGVILACFSVAVSVITFIAFWIILFTGKYPKGLYDFIVGYMRWNNRVNAYLYFLRDEYPPFTTEE
ncbi:MAG: DUF4389 domain-containing protein [Dehalococcoidales bacterium]|nr:DUF4389 domain-containing protein [Dehalococcoidales bacterium]